MKEKKTEKKTKRIVAKEPALSLTADNYKLMALGVGLLVVGYFLMSIGPADSFWSLTLSPIVLLFAYCVVFPLALLWKKKSS